VAFQLRRDFDPMATRQSTMWRICCAMPAIVLLTGPSSLKADVLFTQGSPTGDRPLYYSHGPNSGAFANIKSEVAEGFTLPVAATPTTLQWFGARSGAPPGSAETFLLRLYSSLAIDFVPGSQTTLIYEESTSVVGTSAGGAGLSYTAPFAPGPLAAGKFYSVSILDNDPSTSASGWQWGEFTSPGLSVAFRQGESGSWVPTLGDEGVDLTVLGSPSPEPSSVILWGLGTLAFSVFAVCRSRNRL
jgi:hypothetical protein